MTERELYLKNRIKAQNESAKNRWETVSCRLPIGTKARITAAGETVNGLINKLVLAELARIERGGRSADHPGRAENDPSTVTWESLQKQYFE